MVTWAIVLALCLTSFITADHDNKSHKHDNNKTLGEDHNKTDGYENVWKKMICEKNDQTLYQDIESCFRMESKAIRDATEDCIKEALPSSEGTLVSYLTAACKDKSLFEKYEECFSEYEANTAFKKLMEILPPVMACYDEVFKKHDMEPFLSYINMTTAA
ncbi:uncharacterized protein LOC118190497 isoform X1 [Stegodyphus dumicola]|uniref:uncharacterized protein LOC118190497 isoform X1 n=2 Tax=Stegodyphus dumicola TaxID=202533 RepID=UPI0015AB5D61|nr:uncharacterized protein LOC118190497 isoform X1 [Stegodyphus dumicola]